MAERAIGKKKQETTTSVAISGGPMGIAGTYPYNKGKEWYELTGFEPVETNPEKNESKATKLGI